jgi:uncharacterized protein (DUF1015 family)
VVATGSRPERAFERAPRGTRALRPFRAGRYDLERVGDLAAVLGPPDDVPTAEQAAALAAHHPYHCLHLEVPDADGYSFQRAAAQYRAWRATGILARDEEPSCYVYAHRFRLDGGIATRLGVYLAASLAPDATARLLPHEGTNRELVERRLRQLAAVRAHAGAVYAVWAGDGTLRQALEASIAGAAPLWEHARGEEQHALWRVTGPAVEELAALAASRPLVIADGHHRFAAALRYARDQQITGTLSHPAAWVPVHVVDAADPALAVRAIHRLVRWLPGDWETLQAHLARHARIVAVRALPSPEEAARLAAELARASQPRVLLLQERELLELALPTTPDDEPDAILVDALLLRHVCALEAETIEQVVEYTPDARAAAQAVLDGRALLAVLVRPTPLATVLAWAQAGRLFPPKTTYFFPKLPQGLVFYDLADPATLG